MMSFTKRTVRKAPPTPDEVLIRRVALGLVLVLGLYGLVWMVLSGLGGTGHADFPLFGERAATVFGSMPHLTYLMLGIYTGLVWLNLIGLFLRSRWCLLALVIAVPWHLVMWLRIAFNPYMPAWPGLVFVILGVAALVLQLMLDHRRLLH